MYIFMVNIIFNQEVFVLLAEINSNISYQIMINIEWTNFSFGLVIKWHISRISLGNLNYFNWLQFCKLFTSKYLESIFKLKLVIFLLLIVYSFRNFFILSFAMFIQKLSHLALIWIESRTITDIIFYQAA